MIRYFNSFSFSVFIHIVLIVIVFFSYKHLTVEKQEQNKEELLCFNLSSMCESSPVSRQPHIKKNVPKTKPVKLVKPVEQKTSMSKKFKKLIKLEPKIQEALKEETIVKEVSVQKMQSKKKIKSKKIKSKIKKSIAVKPQIVKLQPEEEYIDENLQKIIALLQENLYYPRRARKRGIQGEILVRFTLSVEAKISKIEIISSNHDVLSRGAIKTIQNIDNKLPKPKQSITFNIPIAYSLHD